MREKPSIVKLNEEKYRLVNLAGTHICRLCEGLEKDSLGRIPCWDESDQRWRLVKRRWLIPVT